MTTANKNLNKHQLREGGILLVVLMLVLVFSALGIGLLSLARKDAQETAYLDNQSQAFWVAEAGLHELRGIVTDEDNRGPLLPLQLVDDTPGTPVLQRNMGGAGSFEVFVTNRGANNGIVKYYNVRSVGRSPSGYASVTVSCLLTVTTEAGRLWGTNRENGIWFATGDIVNGMAHTNGKYYIWGNPLFLDTTSSSWDTLRYNDLFRGGANSTFVDTTVFTQGLTLGAAEIDFDADLIDNLKGDATVLNGNYEIVFNSNGTYTRRSYTVDRRGGKTWTSPATTHGISIINPEDNILYITGDVDVSGDVAGRMSIASDNTISIVNDLVYASAPDPNHANWPASYQPNNNEALGLFSKKKVEIDYPSPRGKEVNIHAAIFVTEPVGRISNPGFGAADRYAYLNTPYINLYGSIVQHTRGVIGTTRGAGYLKNYKGDARFKDMPPPGSPYRPPIFSQWKVSL